MGLLADMICYLKRGWAVRVCGEVSLGDGCYHLHRRGGSRQNFVPMWPDFVLVWPGFCPCSAGVCPGVP